jgi:hypothetical protein
VKLVLYPAGGYDRAEARPARLVSVKNCVGEAKLKMLEVYLKSMLFGLLHDVAAARLTLTEVVFLLVVDVDFKLVIDVVFLVDELILTGEEDDFLVEVVIFREDDVDTFKNPAT